MSTPFVVTRSVNDLNGFGLPFTVDNYNVNLAINVAQSITIPANYQNWELVITYEQGATVWVALNTTAAVPSSSFAQSASQMNPAGRTVKAGDTVSFITGDTTAMVNVSLLYLDSNNRG